MFEEFLEPIAAAYAAARSGKHIPSEPRTIAAWAELALDSVDRAAGIRLLLDVGETDDPKPYASPREMFEDIARGRFVVSTANSEHPVWTVEQNTAFRIVHDVLGHYGATVRMGGDKSRCLFCNVPDWGETHCHACGVYNRETSLQADFGWAGENLACREHVRLLPTGRKGPRMALFCECIAQTAFAIYYERFGPQKVADLPDWWRLIEPDLASYTEEDDAKRLREAARAAYSQWFFV